MGRRHRIPERDYAAPGCYFVTIVTAERRALLGRVRDAALIPSPIGSVVEAAWLAIPTFRPWVRLGTFTLMPDHIHGVLSWIAVPRNRPGSLSIVVNGMKCDATRRARAAGLLRPEEPLWQRSFDVRFILSRTGSIRVHRYILNNPRKAWVKRRR